MKLLLDTHALLWWLTDDAQLSARALQVIKNPRNAVWASPVSGPISYFRFTIPD